jgi:enoyl-CoA hydratase
MPQNILIEKRDRIALITINRPDKLNALNIKTRQELAEALDELRADDAVRVVVSTGAGEKSFVAGADIAEFEGRTALEQRRVMRAKNILTAAEDFPKPIIAMINGFCLGGGCELALACDIRVASDRARFGQPEINLGIIPGGGGTQRLTRLVGEGKAMQMILTGEMINAEEAYRLGLVNEVYPAPELEAKTMELANRIAEKSPVALAMAKAAIKNAARMNLREGLDQEIDLFALCFSSADKEEGVRAFLEKRKPEFKGR